MDRFSYKDARTHMNMLQEYRFGLSVNLNFAIFYLVLAAFVNFVK